MRVTVLSFQLILFHKSVSNFFLDLALCLKQHLEHFLSCFDRLNKIIKQRNNVIPSFGFYVLLCLFGFPERRRTVRNQVQPLNVDKFLIAYWLIKASKIALGTWITWITFS